MIAPDHHFGGPYTEDLSREPPDGVLIGSLPGHHGTADPQVRHAFRHQDRCRLNRVPRWVPIVEEPIVDSYHWDVIHLIITSHTVWVHASCSHDARPTPVPVWDVSRALVLLSLKGGRRPWGSQPPHWRRFNRLSLRLRRADRGSSIRHAGLWLLGVAAPQL